MFTGISFRKLLSPARILVILAVSITANAQSTGTLQGRVVDANDDSVTGAKVTATHYATGVSRVGETDTDGNYTIPALPIGEYRVEV